MVIGLGRRSRGRADRSVAQVERLSDSEPQALFGYVAEALNRFGLAYLHVIEPRVVGS